MMLLALQGTLAVAQHTDRPKAVFEEQSAVLSDSNGTRAAMEQLDAERFFEA